MPTNGFSAGLTGGIGSGKSFIAHQLTAADGAAMPAIRAQFGDSFVTATGALDRIKMRECIYHDVSAKSRLEAILHPLIRSEADAMAARCTDAPYILFIVPLLIESGSWKQRISRLLVIDCPEALQVARVMQRNNMTEAQVRAIMATQATRQERLSAADDVIVNDRDAAALIPEVEHLHKLYSILAQKSP
jgi:dephospho-CoA kinase